MIEVIKRDGRVKTFDSRFIDIAVSKAETEVKNTTSDLGIRIGDLVEDYLIDNNINEISIEDIQNLVIDFLNQEDKEVGVAYTKFRERRNKEREINSSTYKKIDKIIKTNGVLNSNANVDEYSFGGRKFESAGVIMKEYSLKYLMPSEFAEAHLNNEIYQHDLDSYLIGEHNCSFVNARELINNTGFETRNGDVRSSKNLSTAFQQLAVIFQIQSQEQYGGTASGHIDYDLEPQVNISFRKHFADGLFYFSEEFDKYEDEFKVNYFTAKITDGVDYKTLDEEINIENIDKLYTKYPKVMKYAMRELEKEGSQASQGLYHNLNTLESRPGSQVPFTSINFGRRTTVAGRLICKWLLNASLEGIGKFNRTSIFPISIFQYKKGVNAKPSDPNYDEKLKVIDSLCHRIYPNIVNGDWSQNVDDPNNPDTFMMTIEQLVA